VNEKLLALLATLLIPMLLPLLIRKYGLKVPQRKWAVWYAFWIVLASLVVYQIFTIKHELIVEPKVLDFGGEETELEMIITNNGSGVIRWEVQGPAVGWISIFPDDGAVGSEKDIVVVTVNRTILPPEPINFRLDVVGRAGENESVMVRIVG
jgi:hypothetical protein